MGQSALANVTVCEIVDSDVLEFLEGLVNIAIMVVALLN